MDGTSSCHRSPAECAPTRHVIAWTTQDTFVLPVKTAHSGVYVRPSGASSYFHRTTSRGVCIRKCSLHSKHRIAVGSLAQAHSFLPRIPYRVRNDLLAVLVHLDGEVDGVGIVLGPLLVRLGDLPVVPAVEGLLDEDFDGLGLVVADADLE